MSSENQESTATELTKPFEAAMNKRKERWTAQEDQKLAEAVAIHGAKKWTSIASKAGISILIIFGITKTYEMKQKFLITLHTLYSRE